MRAEFALALALPLAACGSSPDVVVGRALKAAVEGDVPRLLRDLDPSYADPLGDRAQVLRDIEDWRSRFPRRDLRTLAIDVDPLPGTRAAVDVLAHLELAFDGGIPTVRAEGPMRLSLQRDGVFRLRSGLLVEVRDVLRLLDNYRAALESQDSATLAALLHPAYRARLRRRDEYETHLKAVLHPSRGAVVRVEPVRLHVELRRDLVHANVHFRRVTEDSPAQLEVARWTLERSAGRLKISSASE
ncbi:MAG: hypothetical protein AAFU79_33025 [Myxococcota bacterium]